MRARNWLKALLMAAVAGVSAAGNAASPGPGPGPYWAPAAGDVLHGPAPDLAESCTSAGTTPVCALKTYLACVLYDAPQLCAAVGLTGLKERYAGPDTLDADVLAQPWALPFERLMPEGFALHIYDGGRVPGSRFQTVRTNGGFEPISKYAEGGFELLMDIPEPYVQDLIYRLSFFFRKNGDGWKMAAWSSSRKAACDTNAGTAFWAPCTFFIKNLRQRDVFTSDVKQIWASPKPPGQNGYPHPGLEIMMGLPNAPVVAPFPGTIVRRSLKYPDMPLYDWVVIEGRDRHANMTVKYAFVDRNGPPAGAQVDAAAPLGGPQWIESEHPGAGKKIHMELLRDGRQIDPRSVMRERKMQEPAQ
jgi:hypothetical protein